MTAKYAVYNIATSQWLKKLNPFGCSEWSEGDYQLFDEVDAENIIKHLILNNHAKIQYELRAIRENDDVHA